MLVRLKAMDGSILELKGVRSVEEVMDGIYFITHADGKTSAYNNYEIMEVI